MIAMRFGRASGRSSSHRQPEEEATESLNVLDATELRAGDTPVRQVAGRDANRPDRRQGPRDGR
jgi:hypothetical protein